MPRFRYCEICSSPFVIEDPNSMKCVKCAVPAHKKRRGRSALRMEYLRLKATGVISTENVVTKNGGRCHLCNDEIDTNLKFPDYMSATIDHVIALSEGGTNHESNLMPAHYKCNTDRHIPGLLK